MGQRAIRGPWQFNNHTVFTGTAATYPMTVEACLVINRASGLATAITLPPTPKKGQTLAIMDGKGDAGTNNITITGAAAATIDGASSLVFTSNYAAAILQYNGTEWNVMARDTWS